MRCCRGATQRVFKRPRRVFESYQLTSGKCLLEWNVVQFETCADDPSFTISAASAVSSAPSSCRVVSLRHLTDGSGLYCKQVHFFTSLETISNTLTYSTSLEMADLLHRLECPLQRAAGASERLRSQVDRIDDYMRSSRLLNLSAAPPNSNGVPVGPNPGPTIPSTYALNDPNPRVRTAPMLGDHPSQFQLPPELLTDLPWPLDSTHTDGFLPLAFEW